MRLPSTERLSMGHLADGATEVADFFGADFGWVPGGCANPDPDASSRVISSLFIASMVRRRGRCAGFPLVLQHPQVIAACDDFGGASAPPWLRFCCLVGQVVNLRRIGNPPAAHTGLLQLRRFHFAFSRLTGFKCAVVPD